MVRQGGAVLLRDHNVERIDTTLAGMKYPCGVIDGDKCVESKGFSQVRVSGERFTRLIDIIENGAQQVDRRFEQLDRRFEEVTRRIDRFMIWSFGLTITVGGLVVGVLKAWP